MSLIIDERFKSVMLERIKKRIQIDSNQCWIWTKSKHRFGYGKYIYTQNGKKFHLSVHRICWIIFKGEIPNDLRVCHKCDIPQCCNPDHLFIGTAKDNTIDMINKGRFADFKGEKNSRAILDEKTVIEMRRLNKNGLSVAQISRDFKVKYFTCLDIINRRNWKHI